MPRLSVLKVTITIAVMTIIIGLAAMYPHEYGWREVGARIFSLGAVLLMGILGYVIFCDR